MAERLNSNQKESRSLLSRPKILEHIVSGEVVIDPFDFEKLGTVSYDVTLGPWHFRPNSNGLDIYNPWSEENVRQFWGEPQHATPAQDTFGSEIPEGIMEDDHIIMINPGELLLCHTDEFIGGRNNVTTMMKARSSMGRSGITVCKCAGWGDVGYTNRWTMEIQNEQSLPIPLVVGRRVALIAFFEVDPIENDDYVLTGKYQTTGDLEELKANWTPDAMLPKLWKDRELQR